MKRFAKNPVTGAVKDGVDGGGEKGENFGVGGGGGRTTGEARDLDTLCVGW